MNQMIRPKDVYYERSDAEMAEHLPGETTFSLRQKLALACRMLANDGHASGLAGQITARGEDPSTFWTQRFGLGLEEMSASNLLLVDGDLNVIEGHGMPNPANRFHIWIYRARPDVACIIHTHPFWCSALGMLEEPLVVSHMDTTHLYEDCAFLARWPGVPFGDEEGRVISQALGDKRAVLLAHHGQLVACGSVEEAAVLSLTIDRAARLHMAARAVSEIKPASYRATFAYHARRTLITDADCLS